jgi:6-phosphofructokinase
MIKTKKVKNNICYAQSGGPTAVINETARGLIDRVKKYKPHFGKILAGLNGIVGVLQEDLIDVAKESSTAIKSLHHTPGAAFHSCRYKLKDKKTNKAEYERLIQVFEAHSIGYFFYNGGNDSQDTAHKISMISQEMGYPVSCIGIPKTIDNDLPFTDCCPGFGSVAKYVATSLIEASLDIAAMAETSTKVFILEVMGRHAGWIAASAGLASQDETQGPHIILFPEIAFNPEKFLAKVKQCVKRYGYCVIAASEGTHYKDGRFLADSGLKDAFGHSQLGGVAPLLSTLIKDKLQLKTHWAVSDYLQRSARHIVSATDLKQAYAVGKAAVDFAYKGKNSVMPTIVRLKGKTYRWKVGEIPLSKVANVEKTVPRNFISSNGFHITNAAREYLLPLIKGESFPPFKNGLPKYGVLKKKLVAKKLKRFRVS